MYLNAENVTVDSDEGRFILVIDSAEEDPITVNIHGIDLDAFYQQVRGRIEPYLREMEDARATYRTDPASPGFAGVGETIADVGHKHPDWHSIHVDLWDNRDKTR